MKIEIKIKPYSPEHLESIVSLSLRAWEPVFESVKENFDPELYQYYYPDWRVHQQKEVEKVCQSDDTKVWVAWDLENIAGFVAIKLDNESKTGEIYMIAVDPVFQRRGISSALTDFATQQMKDAGMEIAMLSTGADPGHGPARYSYEKSGFKPWHSVIYLRN